MLIFKICHGDAWQEAEREGTYRGSAKDKADGFLHFSDAGQLRGTLERYYATEKDTLVIAAVRAETLGDALKWEFSRNGEKFPHLYAALPMSSVVATCAASYSKLSERDFAAVATFLAGLPKA